jgi:cation/acetate symporter
MNREGAIAGMLTGLLSTLMYIFWFKGWFLVAGTQMEEDYIGNWVLGISPESFGAVGALLNFAVAMIVCRLTAPVPEYIEQFVEDIRVPRRTNALESN